MMLMGLPNRKAGIVELYDLASIWAVVMYRSDEMGGNEVDRMIIYMLDTGCQLSPGGRG
jgi:hypothetical protein